MYVNLNAGIYFQNLPFWKRPVWRNNDNLKSWFKAYLIHDLRSNKIWIIITIQCSSSSNNNNNNNKKNKNNNNNNNNNINNNNNDDEVDDDDDVDGGDDDDDDAGGGGDGSDCGGCCSCCTSSSSYSSLSSEITWKFINHFLPSVHRAINKSRDSIRVEIDQ